ncbi:MAG TPA: hypothetical protein VFG72_08540 [Marmoricola sp.]|nr:hypothetical protein [Marmoricola sp.]
MTLSNSPDDLEFGDVSGDQADVTSPGDPETMGKDAPSSGRISGEVTEDTSGTDDGTPLAGVDQPDDDVVYPEGSGPA